MKKERKDESFIKQPYYIGGDKALTHFIHQHLKYPETSIANQIEGDVHIRFEINHKGSVVDAKIIGGLDDACNTEALRVVKLLNYAVPKAPRNLKVTFHKNIRIHFRKNNLPATTDLAVGKDIPSQNIQIQYNIVSTPQVVAKEEIQKPKPIYTYTINLG